MRLWIRSDLHCPLDDLQFLHSACPAHDVQVIAGDTNYGLRRTIEAIDKVAPMPVVFVAGNHEFYHRQLDQELAEARLAADVSRSVFFLERQQWIHAGVRFLGATLWTDFRLYGFDARSLSMQHAREGSPDFQLIRRRIDDREIAFTPEHAASIFQSTIAWLDARFAEPFDGPTVVVTHHVPSKRSIDPRFAGDPLTPCYVSDLSAQIERWQPDLWIHGHVHTAFDYSIGRTRVVCNPRGFDAEQTGYDHSLVIEI
ncbi:metallophosphoesterase [Aureimonas sp. SK2]|uniref:metallophosphoesterase n=1 Tax=Aureimonas sp. SK2 TaxID=3015992 RepID=UPI0024447F5D|nr:metallophosphoesterase [Aureimonas sp. SK2]